MKILVVGGGSGGHIVPALAVAAEIKQQQPDATVGYLIGRRDKLTKLVRDNPAISDVHQIFSGKLRRYHGQGLLQLLDIPTTLKNLRDMVYVAIGFVQSLIILRKHRPDVMFIKGGFVGVPVGLAAAILKIPYVTHDSDSVPGLANRLISKWAKAHAVGMPKGLYKYPADKTFELGTPIPKEFTKVEPAEQTKLKEEFGMPASSPCILITGGGLGAQRLNLAVAGIAHQLMAKYPELTILHISGPGKDNELAAAYRTVLTDEELDRVEVEPFVNDMYRYSGAADVIVTRAGASTLAEFAAQAKACVVVPNHQLTGGHQTKNAQALVEAEAIVSVDDQTAQKNPVVLLKELDNLLSRPSKRQTLASNLHNLSRPNATKDIASLVVTYGQNKVAA